MDIQYTDSLEGVEVSQFEGFFVGWEKVPTPAVLLKVLQNSTYVSLARCEGKIVGFATALSDKTLAAYISLVEVLPEYQGKGIGGEVVKRLLNKLENIYMVDLLCDKDVEGFYEKFGFHKTSAMMLRHYDKQAGEA
jgi:ribosomal protein S18 acetylase RimI-like enzyme